MPLFAAFAGTTLVYLVVRSFDVPAWVSLATKPLPMLLLLGATLRGRPTAGRRLATLGAIVFSLVGDVALIFKSSEAFLVGLGGFLVAHLFYIAAFVRPPAPTATRVALSGLLVPYGVALNALLWSNTGALRIPVAVYSAVLLGLLVVTLLARGLPRSVTVGAAVFAASDSLLALQLFGFAFPLGGTLSMALYEAAQWLLVTAPATDSDPA